MFELATENESSLFEASIFYFMRKSNKDTIHSLYKETSI